MKLYSIFCVFFVQILAGQSKTGYYLHWDLSHARINVRPTIKITEAESKVLNSYFVEFDTEGKFISASYYYRGNPSEYGNFGAHQIKRHYSENYYEDHFYNSKKERITNSRGVHSYKYSLNADGFWLKKERFSSEGKAVEERGIAINILTRDEKGRRATELQLNLKNDTIPEPNGFKLVHVGYDNANFLSYRKNLNAQDELVNGPSGYAIVNFQFDENGMFLGENFRDADGKLVRHPRIRSVSLNFRDFNKYGKFHRIYYQNEKGYPDSPKAMAKVEYNSDMSRHKVSYFDRYGNNTEDHRGISYSIFVYESSGKLLRRDNYNLDGKLLK